MWFIIGFFSGLVVGAFTGNHFLFVGTWMLVWLCGRK